MSLFALLLTACLSVEENKMSTENSIKEPALEQDPDEKEEVEEETISMRDFFPSNDVSLHFKGEGNEFAELDIEIFHVDEDGEHYIVKRENNGGVYFQSVYKISQKKIELLEDNIINLDEPFPKTEELRTLDSIGIYLQSPIKEGTTFESWEIVDVNATIETPYKLFNNVIIIESQDSDFINRKYFARGFGEIKRETVLMMDDETDYIVTSTIESMDEL